MTAPDELARRRVRAALDDTLFVEAGAGSGKTQMLVDRIVALVASGVPITAIAAITFTEKAATELRDRVRRALFDAGHHDAVDAIDTAALGTLHAFAQRILREHPIEASLPPAVEVLDEIGSQIAFEARWRVMRERLFVDPPRARSLLLANVAGARVEAFADVAAALDDNWDLIDTHVPTSVAAPPPVAAADLAGRARRVAQERSAARAGDRLADRLAALEEWADEVDGAEGDEVAVLELLAPDGDLTKAWRTGTRGRQQNWPTGRQDEVLAELAELVEVIDRRRGDVLHAAVNHLVAALGTFTLEAADERRRQGQLEFHDLLVLARELLRRDPGARAALHQRYQRLLLDEFQDTDPIQIELAARIAAAPDAEGEWFELAVEPGRLFVVGDPKQSIYRFRRADLATFLTARRALVTEPVLLTANFRTAEPVIDWLNHVFGRLIVAVPAAQPQYVPLQPTRPAPAVGPAVTVLGAVADPDDATADERRTREAADVAAAVTTVLAEGWSVDRDGDPRAATAGDITVLLPARTSLPALERAFEAAGIHYRAESSSLVYGTPEIRALLLAVRAIDDPSDELALVATLRSVLFGCSDADLFRWRHQRGGRFSVVAPEWPAAIDDDPVGDALGALSRLAADRHWLTPSELLDRLVRERRLLELGFVVGRPRDLWRRVRFVVDQARAWSEAGGRGLRAYLDWAYRQAAEGGGARVVEAVLPETDDDAVRIMTIHAAKGLEFPITIVSGLTTRPAGARTGARVLWGEARVDVKVGRHVTTERFDESKALDDQLSHHERLRLLYVACTRARDHLVVSLHRGRDLDEPVENATSAELLAWAAADAPHHEPLVVTAAPGLSADAAPVPAVEAWPWADEATWRAERDRVLARAHRPGTVAATTVAEAAADDPGLATDLFAAARGPVRDHGRARDRGPAPVRDPALAKDAPDLELPPWLKGRYGTAIGRAVHAVLQTVDLATGAGLAEAAAAQAAAEGVLGHEARIAELARSALRAPSVREAAALPHWRELYVATPLGDTLLEGYVDLLYRSALGLVVVDYKTDQAGDERALDERVERYRLQGAAYALAVERVTGEPVHRMVFVFCAGRRAAAEREITDLRAAVSEVAVVAGSLAGGGPAPPPVPAPPG